MSTELEKKLVKVLREAREHLVWIGWGDSYERECIYANGLPTRIDEVLDDAEKEGI